VLGRTLLGLFARCRFDPPVPRLIDSAIYTYDSTDTTRACMSTGTFRNFGSWPVFTEAPRRWGTRGSPAPPRGSRIYFRTERAARGEGRARRVTLETRTRCKSEVAKCRGLRAGGTFDPDDSLTLRKNGICGYRRPRRMSTANFRDPASEARRKSNAR